MQIRIEPLAARAFAPFGDVVEAAGAQAIEINQGFARRYDGLAGVDVGRGGGEISVSLFRARPRPVPIVVALMERHPLGSQLFAPMQNRDWLVLVCADPADAKTYRAFRASGAQGVNYARNVWHHPLLALDDDSLFLVVDRAGPGNNLEEFHLHAAAPLRLIP